MLLRNSTEKINQCLDFCNLQRLTNDMEVKFLEEYYQVMEPLARSLNILQSDKGMYMGYLLPVLTTLQQKLENLNKSNLVDCHSLVKAIQKGLSKKFSTTFKKKKRISNCSLFTPQI